MQSEKKELAELVRRIQEGDREAFETVYRRFMEPVYAYVFQQVRSHPDTEDIVSGVWLEVLQKIGNFNWRGAGFAAWLFSIARYDVLDYFRRGGRKREVVLSEEVEQMPSETSIEAAAERKWEARALRDALDGLSEEQRQVMILKLMFDFTNRQIAEVLGKNEGAVKALRHRALSSLKNILEARDGSRQQDLVTD